MQCQEQATFLPRPLRILRGDSVVELCFELPQTLWNVCLTVVSSERAVVRPLLIANPLLPVHVYK